MKTARINLAYLEEITGGDKAAMKMILQSFLDNSPKDIQKLKSAIASEDFPSTAQIAHKLKSNFQYIGDESSAKLLKQMQIFAETSKNAKRIGEIMATIDQNYTNALAEVKTACKEITD